MSKTVIILDVIRESRLGKYNGRFNYESYEEYIHDSAMMQDEILEYMLIINKLINMIDHKNGFNFNTVKEFHEFVRAKKNKKLLEYIRPLRKAEGAEFTIKHFKRAFPEVESFYWF